MPYNPGGLFSLVASYFATAGQTIRTEQHNPPLEDIASALSNVLVRDGRAPMTGPLNMNGQVINNVSVGSTPTSVATLAQATPIGGGMDFWGATPPSLWLFASGQAVSRATYENLFAVLGTTYGAGDGSTTFNLPDKRGRVSAGLDNLGGTAANRLSAGAMAATRNTLGGVGGEDVHTLTIPEMPSHNHTITDPGHIHSILYGSRALSNTGLNWSHAADTPLAQTDNTNSATTGISIVNAGGGGSHNNVQPTIMCTYIIYAGA